MAISRFFFALWIVAPAPALAIASPSARLQIHGLPAAGRWVAVVALSADLVNGELKFLVHEREPQVLAAH